MKRIISIVIAVLLLSGTAYAALYAEPVYCSIMLNGEAMKFPEDGPANINGRTYLPLRPIAEALGVNILWANNQVEIQTFDPEELKDSCVMLYAGQRIVTHQASGVLIDYDKVLTCWHAVDEGYDTFQIFYNGSDKEHACILKNSAPSVDAAILTPSDKTVKPAKIGDSDDVNVGDKVYVISSPNGSKNIVKTATIYNEDSHVNGYTGFEFSPVTSGGSSGGAVFNAKGELIAIVQSGDNISSFAIPINDIRKALAN